MHIVNSMCNCSRVYILKKFFNVLMTDFHVFVHVLWAICNRQVFFKYCFCLAFSYRTFSAFHTSTLLFMCAGACLRVSPIKLSISFSPRPSFHFMTASGIKQKSQPLQYVRCSCLIYQCVYLYVQSCIN